jgi:hypothetical protein
MSVNGTVLTGRSDFGWAISGQRKPGGFRWTRIDAFNLPAAPSLRQLSGDGRLFKLEDHARAVAAAGRQRPHWPRQVGLFLLTRTRSACVTVK